MFDAMGNHLKPDDPVCWAARVADSVTLRFGKLRAVGIGYVTIQPAGMKSTVIHRVRKMERVLRLSSEPAWLKETA